MDHKLIIMKQSHSQNRLNEKKIESQSLIFNKRFQVKKRISSGSFGVVFACQDLHTKEYVALKIEKKETSKFMSLQKEIAILEHLQGLAGKLVPLHL